MVLDKQKIKWKKDNGHQKFEHNYSHSFLFVHFLYCKYVIECFNIYYNL